MTGGLKHAAEMSWRSPTRLCILIADGPCHGNKFHAYHDDYPLGDPNGLDPIQLLYTLQVKHNNVYSTVSSMSTCKARSHFKARRFAGHGKTTIRPFGL